MPSAGHHQPSKFTNGRKPPTESPSSGCNGATLTAAPQLLKRLLTTAIYCAACLRPFYNAASTRGWFGSGRPDRRGLNGHCRGFAWWPAQPTDYPAAGADATRCGSRLAKPWLRVATGHGNRVAYHPCGGTQVSRVVQVFSSVLEMPIEQITDRTSTSNTPEWDSLAGMNLVLAIEAEFRVKLTSKEINSMRTVGIVRRVLTSKGVVDA